MKFFKYPEEIASITNMSRLSWGINRVGICLMLIGMATFLATLFSWAPTFSPLIGGAIFLAGYYAWFFAGPPV